ncbi:MAG: hypothetical protein GX859_11510 [Corynebacterium humireducens]|jgi:hypothetical protein|uniref:Uncharacterized protein n=1 Tax=Corynebacterium humireducens TaxID=1223514 RepID=A0A7X6PPS7_9CORY|nr:hypothetical protein [Corynebacterium humireducens]
MTSAEFVVGTEGALIAFGDFSALSQFADRDMGWVLDVSSWSSPAVRENIAMFSPLADGGYAVLVTDDPAELSRLQLTDPLEFRVPGGTLLLDGGDNLPQADRWDGADPAVEVTVPEGPRRVRVFATREWREDWPDYVILHEPAPADWTAPLLYGLPGLTSEGPRLVPESTVDDNYRRRPLSGDPQLRRLPVVVDSDNPVWVGGMFRESRPDLDSLPSFDDPLTGPFLMVAEAAEGAPGLLVEWDGASQRPPEPVILRWVGREVGCLHQFDGATALLAPREPAPERPAEVDVETVRARVLELLPTDPEPRTHAREIRTVAALLELAARHVPLPLSARFPLVTGDDQTRWQILRRTGTIATSA